MENTSTSKEKRTRKKYKRGFKMGDLFWYDHPKYGQHLTIVLKNHSSINHQDCIAVCNFAIDLSNWTLLDEWFPNGQKATNWVLCNPIDCVKLCNEYAETIKGNLIDQAPELMKYICDKVKSCKIAERLKEPCSCLSIDVPLEIVDSDDECSCNNPNYPEPEPIPIADDSSNENCGINSNCP